MSGAAVLALMTTQLFAGGEGWTADFEAAKKQAAGSGKDLLVDFTGSDWCGWCIKLNKEVFEHDAFKNGVKDTFVLVELDFPKDKSKVSEATQKQNKELAQAYAVRGYPTILLCDANGRPYAKTGYQKGGPEEYVKQLNELRESRVVRDKAFADAEKATGVEKAKALAKALDSIKMDDAMITKFYSDTIAQIKAADPADETGYVKKAEQAGKVEAFRAKLMEFRRAKNDEGALKLCDDVIAEGSMVGVDGQRVIATKAMILLNGGHFDEAVAQIDKAIAYLPESKENDGLRGMREKIINIKQQVEQKKATEGAKPAEPKPAEPKPDEPIRARDKK